jgi:predicted DNA-binding protein YlxM (UPF0122 family)
VEKNVQIGMLLDFYGEFLTQRQRAMLRMHYDEDISLGEIAQEVGITRQGVHDALKKGEATLVNCEQRLQLVQRYLGLREVLAETREYVLKAQGIPQQDAQALLERMDGMLRIWEG